MTTLAPVETTPVLLMKFSDNAPQNLMDAVAERLVEGGLIIVVKEHDILGLTTTQVRFIKRAAHTRIKSSKRPRPNVRTHIT